MNAPGSVHPSRVQPYAQIFHSPDGSKVIRANVEQLFPSGPGRHISRGFPGVALAAPETVWPETREISLPGRA